ncbi:MAG: GNAT family N-acetyltransferase [Saprospiraceae bacterium]
MDSRTRYSNFAAAALDLPVFMQAWYLDAVCAGGAWDAVFVEKAGQTVAAWPFFVKKKWAWRYVSMPPLCRMMGPWLLPKHRNTDDEHRIYAELLAQMPRFAAFQQDGNYQFTNWLALYWQGWRQTTRYSYVLNINDLGVVWQGMAADYRNHKIKKASQQVRIRRGGDLAELYRVHNLSFGRQGMKPPFAFAFLKNLDAALAAHQAREVFFAEDLATGATHAIAYVIWDKTAAYLLLAGDDPALRASGAGVLVIWEAIKFASEELRLPVFDFAGSMIPGVERVRRQFGARQQPYFRVQKEWSPLFKIGKMLLR